MDHPASIPTRIAPHSRRPKDPCGSSLRSAAEAHGYPARARCMTAWLAARPAEPGPGCSRWPKSHTSSVPGGPCLAGDDGQKAAHNGGMRDSAGHVQPQEKQGLWRQQVQLSRGHWLREDAAGASRSAGWWESVTVTWSPASAPGRRPATLQRALAAAADMIAPVLADVAVASTRRLLERRHRTYPVAPAVRRQLAPAARELPGADRTP
jgi:hypothetical protein